MVAALLLSAMVEVQSANPGDNSTAAPVSVERVADALSRPPRLQIALPPLPDPAVTFRIETWARPLLPDWPPPWFVGHVDDIARPEWMKSGSPAFIKGGSPALAQIDMVPIGMAIAREIRKVFRERAEREAREEVQRALREFCGQRACD